MSQSKAYERFNMLKFNRDLNRKHINEIKKSISEHGYLPSNPIIVDKDLNILDGQHRFIACKEMNLPIYYEIIEAPEDIIISLNTLQKRWNLSDYINYYANKGNAHYQRIKQINKKYGLAYDLILTISNKIATSGTVTNTVRRGGLCFTLDDGIRVQGTSQLLKDICNNLRFGLTGRIAAALVEISNKRNFKWDRMIKQSKDYSTVAYKCRTKDEYIQMFKDLYNYQSRKEEVRI